MVVFKENKLPSGVSESHVAQQQLIFTKQVLDIFQALF